MTIELFDFSDALVLLNLPNFLDSGFLFGLRNSETNITLIAMIATELC